MYHIAIRFALQRRTWPASHKNVPRARCPKSDSANCLNEEKEYFWASVAAMKFVNPLLALLASGPWTESCTMSWYQGTLWSPYHSWHTKRDEVSWSLPFVKLATAELGLCQVHKVTWEGKFGGALQCAQTCFVHTTGSMIHCCFKWSSRTKSNANERWLIDRQRKARTQIW